MSYRALNWVRTLNILMPNDRYVMLELANHVNHKTLACHPSLRTLAKETRLSLNTVRACIDRLVESGFLAVSPYIQKGARAGTNYTLVGFTNSEGVSIAEGVSTIDTGSMTDTRVYQPLDEGISTIDTGVYQPLLPNREYKQGNKQGNRTSKDIAPKPKRQKQVFEKPDDVSQELFDRIVQHRKDIKKPFKSQDGVNGILKQMRLAKEQSGNSLEEIVDFWAEQEWQGFRSDWYMDILNKQKRFACNNQTTGGYHSVTYVPEIPEDVITDWTDLDEFKN